MSLSNNISSARRKMGFTQEQLAEKCGVSRQAVTKWECGESEPGIAKLVTLSQILQIDLTELITGKKSDDQKKREICTGLWKFVRNDGIINNGLLSTG